MRRALVLPACVLCAVAGVAVGVVVARHRGPALPRPTYYTNIDQALVSADGMVIATSESHCVSGPLTATETDTAVTLHLADTVTEERLPGVCAIRSYSVRLKARLGDRALVDGASGRTVPEFSATGILRPGHLPAGFALAYDTANFTTDHTTDTTEGRPTGPGCIQVYIKDGEYDNALLIAQIVGADPAAPDHLRPTRITVHGQPGMAFPGEIEWTERGQLITIRSMAYAYAVLSTAELVAIGDSLRTT